MVASSYLIFDQNGQKSGKSMLPKQNIFNSAADCTYVCRYKVATGLEECTHS